ncbi:CDP-alcohol phosphatidyltransferase family protein [Aliifodinibius sp. S!AR15-10]|uniref:CDP-alcohol phosphatidyltransferase family protein n=1 Tax=Aliifodinibius sp. S!AR15-10 TaxID=2950437 RepID=UPI00285EB6D1|nr:CDP-alcohol phosphatidyltransferase family protein [Aliifodinibius sp. S!AR15-10]MDR8393129.1 CDP-alcohol phosphatidyltransferase family protein [Aliifodinibius sp. S!AR15-10]
MKISAYGVHVLTAVGAALGLWSIILIYDGYYQHALWVLALSVFIDSIDGTLARAFDITKEAPKIDGALMDNIIDFVTWTIAPLFWAYAAMLIPLWVVMICAICSILGFSNTRAKTSDDFFLGFPSYWNIVVLYLFLLDLPLTFSSAVLLLFAAATLIPVKFIYPTKTVHFKTLTILLGSLFFLQLLLLLYLFDESPPLLIYSSFLFPVYYFGLSFYLNVKKVET